MPRERIPRAARFVLKFLKTRAGGSEKKLAAKATAARKLHYAKGGSGSHGYLAGQDLTSARAHQLLLQTVNSAQSYPPFALLPLLQGSQKQSAGFWPASHLARRRYHRKAPCFAACPLYAKPQPQPLLSFPMRLACTSPIRRAAAQKAQQMQVPSDPLYKYATLCRVQLIQSVPVLASKHAALTGLHTYAGLARPVSASNQAGCTPQQSRQALQQFTQLSKKTAGQVGTRAMSATAADGRTALRSYAQLGRRS